MVFLDGYREMLAAGTGYMSVSMPIRPRPELPPKYVLVLFTRPVEGVWCFADALGPAGREWSGSAARGVPDPADWDAVDAVHARVAVSAAAVGADGG